MKRLLSASLALVLPAAAALPGPAGFSFAKGAKFAVAGYEGTEPLAGFPVLVRVREDSPEGFHYADLSSSAGTDLCFVDMDGTGLPFEIDTWDPSGESLVWVRLPAMTNGTEFVMCWGGGTFAVSGWVSVGSAQTGNGNDARLFSRKESFNDTHGWEVMWKTTKQLNVRGASNENTISASDLDYTGKGWKHLFVVYDGANAAFYENGAPKESAANGVAPTENGNPLAIGGYVNDKGSQLLGAVDECRLLDAVPSEDWAKAECASMADAAFLTAGEAEPYGLLPLTAYALRLRLVNPWGLATVVDLGAATTLPASGAAELFVDSLGSGDGSSPDSALPTIRAALDIAGPGYTIWVRGGPGRAYAVASDADAIPVSADLTGLSIRGYADTPGDGGRAALSVSDTYVADGGTAHVFSIAAADVTLAGFACSYGPKSLAEQYKNECLFVAVSAQRFTLSDCEFFCTGVPPYAGSGRNGIVAALKVDDDYHAAAGMTIERCFFHDTVGYRGDVATAPLLVPNNTTIRECVFTNVWGIARDTGPGKTKFRDFTFVSNVVCAGAIRGDAGYFSFANQYGSLFASGYGGLGPGAEIAHNVFVGSGDPNRGIFAFSRWDGFGGVQRFHHNVVWNFGWIWGFNRGGNPTGKTVVEFFDNLVGLAEGGSVARDEGFTDGAPNVGTPLFVAGSFSRRNAILAPGAFWGGASALAEGYDRSVVTLLDDIALDAPPVWVCTNDVFSADFYRYRTSRTASVDLGVLGWRGENGEHPLWIGAKPPLYPEATMLILK